VILPRPRVIRPNSANSPSTFVVVSREIPARAAVVRGEVDLGGPEQGSCGSDDAEGAGDALGHALEDGVGEMLFELRGT
jgi:hypothetical protein